MQSLRQFLSYMNEIDFSYVVLRNFDNLPHSVVMGEHSDLDLLVYDLEHWMEIFPQAERVFPHPRVRFKMPIAESYVYIDVRYIKDGYYPQDFERGILDAREWNNGFYTPNPLHFRIGLAYHAVHHKNSLSQNYIKYLGTETAIEDLKQALKASSIGWVEPLDPSVGRFNSYFSGATSIVEKKGDTVIKKQKSYADYSLIDNEARVLSKCNSAHFPKVIESKNDTIELEDCGEELTADNLPKNWKEQLVEIIQDLKANKIQHRDIKPDNLMVRDGIIKLIDFGWARLEGDTPDNPPDCLGYPYKPTDGWDDNFSMVKVIKELSYQKEEECVY